MWVRPGLCVAQRGGGVRVSRDGGVLAGSKTKVESTAIGGDDRYGRQRCVWLMAAHEAPADPPVVPHCRNGGMPHPVAACGAARRVRAVTAGGGAGLTVSTDRWALRTALVLKD